MKKLAAIIILAFGLCLAANADIWKWVDAYGKTHFVETDTPIYTWIDENGKVHYSDVPEHVSAVSAELVWHSTGALTPKAGSDRVATTRPKIDPDETTEERTEREMAEAYYCKRAREIYESYISAPKLYTTTSEGDKIYLTDEETAVTLADTAAKVAQLCD